MGAKKGLYKPEMNLYRDGKRKGVEAKHMKMIEAN